MRVVNPRQQTQFQSPWSLGERILLSLWHFTWTLCCIWTPKPFNPWRLFILKLFGAKIYGLPFVHQRARIQIPWNLTLEHRACLGDRANAYSLGSIIIGKSATIAQEAYLCTGSHDFSNPSMPLVVSNIIIEEYAFIGARAMILPGVKISKHAIVGAQSVVTRDVADYMVVAGNPAIVIRQLDRR